MPHAEHLTPAEAPTVPTCDSYAYTNRRGACHRVAAKLLIVTFSERMTQRLRLCNRHVAGVYEDLADPLFAYLGCTGVTEAPIASAEQLRSGPATPGGGARPASALSAAEYQRLTLEEAVGDDLVVGGVVYSRHEWVPDPEDGVRRRTAHDVHSDFSQTGDDGRLSEQDSPATDWPSSDLPF
ncbi:hypothetical protein OG413_40085 [Streptomyces sp. NBC_01433]|uniref:hypothetical protein n=1 Tax=Streptomyces sp. NBC_01433 TaxID=2903864 RepID=UPI002258DFD2|nr:hypothetical protein [Streptomyces sp. NBC_01433]MCX4681399.1 hypothetical protein [Streptomyces sp. NBC_01433]